MMNKSMGSRLMWVDMAKGIAILAVVLGHINFVYPSITLFPMQMLLYGLWHVSVFFVIGGFFINEQKLEQPFLFIKGKVKSLYLLILYIYIPYVLLHNFFIDIGFYDLSVDYYGKSVTYWGIADYLKNIAAAVFFAGREPLLGPMWFVYVLFMALCLFSILSWCVRKLCLKLGCDSSFEQIRFVVILVLTILSYTLTNFLQFNIPRFNNVFTATWFIYWGLLLIKKYNIHFDNRYFFLFSIIIVYHIATTTNEVAFNSNIYDDLASFSISTLCCTYIICYLSKRLEKSWVSRPLSYIGENSFYIMGLQFTGFRVCSAVLNLCGTDYRLAKLTTPQISNVLLLLVYMFFGVSVPLLIIHIFRYLKSLVLQVIHSKPSA